jgi:macrolide transport system ATP-binding/permease protein
VAAELHATYPEAWTDVNDERRRITVRAERDARIPMMIRGPVLGFMGLLAAVVGIVLLICCANLAGLFLARASRRSREMAIRASLGAGRMRIVRQLLTESLLLAVAGGALGLLGAYWIAGALSAFELPLPVPIALDAAPDMRVFAFTAVVALVAGVAFGLAPALRASRPDPGAILKNETAGATGASRKLSLRNGLVVGQVALSLLLVVGAMLFLRSLQEAGRLELGFNEDNVLLVDALPPPGTRVGAEHADLVEELRRRLAAAPGVVAASWSDNVPFGPGQARRGTSVQGYEPAPGDDMEFHTSVVGPDYFRTMEIPLLSGRGFTPADRSGAPGVIVVNEEFARRFWSEGEALGRRVSVAGDREVVGVVRTGTYLSPAEAPRPFLYIPALQAPGPVTLEVRSAGDPVALIETVRRELAGVTPDWSVATVRTMQDQIGTALLPQRLAGGVLGLFGLLALGLAALGLYGVIAYAMAQRTREIGIRLALGADRPAVLGLVLRQGVGLVGVGAALGLVAALALTRLLEGFLLGADPLDPYTFAGSMLMLGLVALFATWLPARRAARVDPMIALRLE